MGKPTVIYAGDDGALSSNIIQQFLAEQHVQQIISRNHANIAERAIRTIKYELNERLKHYPTARWYDILPSVLRYDNEKKPHSSTGMTPEEVSNGHVPLSITKTPLGIYQI